MEKKKVSFNIQTAECGWCSDSHPNVSEGSATNGLNATWTRDAVVFCKTCGTFICATCQRTHRRLVVMKQHHVVNRDHVVNDVHVNGKFKNGVRGGILTLNAAQVEDEVDQYEKERLNFLKEFASNVLDDKRVHSVEDIYLEEKSDKEDLEPTYNFTEMCPIHNDEYIKHFCEHHKQLCCDVCKIRDHGFCTMKIKFIPEVVDDGENNKTPFKTIDAQIRNFKEHDKRLQGDLKELKKSREYFLHDLKEKKRELLLWINQMEVRAIKRLEAVYERCKSEIDRKRKQTRKACEELRAELYFLKEILKNSMNDSIYKFVKIKQAEIKTEKLKKMKETRQFTTSRFRLGVNDDIEKTQQLADQLYEIKIEKKGEVKYNIRLKEDKYMPNITGCSFMPSGDLALSDRSNAKVKVFDSQFKLMSQLVLPEGVYDLTSISENALAVTSLLKGVINIVEVKPEPSVMKTIKTGNGSCWGVNHHDGIFVVNISVKDNSYIRAVDLDSTVIFQVESKRTFYNEISPSVDGSELVILVATSFTEGQETGEMSVIDEYRDARRSDIVVREYNFLKNLHTRGVTSDGHGNAVICCRDVDQVYTVAKDGSAVELLLSEMDGLKAPQAICYNADRSKLVVTSDNSEFIQMFEFE
ncbi:uncharacterized protein LOC128215355 [Mya arenaria]|uniref:uncharacterized protein LOC128215355 n=1 Tax=Mya arenaria TaxID=6604 RepID=UPI0022E057FE|nr:uncharacterized protein LOC128215355 [Mya arenaria]